MSKEISWVIGVDEAGRGPLAGPVCVGAVAVPKKYNFNTYKKLRDSKKMTELQRTAACKILKAEFSNGNIVAAHGYGSSEMIDERGIMPATTFALTQALTEVEKHLPVGLEKVKVLLDGGLSAPEQFIWQETIVGGDSAEPVISLASVLAKTERDEQMKLFDNEFPQYGFAQHKGYGTKGHREAILEHNPCKIHRRTFLTKMLK